jgi:hypothetical protein
VFEGCPTSGAFGFAVNGNIGWWEPSLQGAAKWLAIVLKERRPLITVWFPFAEIAWRCDSSGTLIRKFELEKYCAVSLSALLHPGNKNNGINFKQLSERAVSNIFQNISAPDERGSPSERLSKAISCAFLNVKLQSAECRMEFRCCGSPLKFTMRALGNGLFAARIWKLAEHIPIATIDEATIDLARDWIFSKIASVSDEAWSNLSRRISVKQL